MKLRRMMICAVFLGAGFFGGSLLAVYIKDKEIKKWFKICQKDERMLKVYSYWLMHKGSYAEYLNRLGVRKVIVYGIGYLGKSLVDELNDSNVKILYALDRNPAETVSGLKIVTPTAIKEGADMVIITAIANFKEIKKEIEKYVNCPIVSIEDVVYRIIE